VSPAIAVVVVTHNSAAKLDALSASLAGELDGDDELVVVDNASSDGTADRARRLGLNVLESGGNLGFAGGCRLGVAATRAPLVFLLNPDARVCAGAIALLRATADAQPVWAAWQPVVLLPDGAINTAGGVVHYLGVGWAGRCGEDAATLPQARYETGFASGAALVVRRAVWEELDGMRDDYFLYGEDLDFGLRVWLAGRRVGVEPRARVIHDYEFDKGPQKWFLLERNRWRTVIATYPLALLLAVAPALIANELGLLFVAARGGWLAEKLRAHLATLAGLRREVARRRSVQRGRRIGSAELAAQLTGSLDSPFLPVPPVLRAAVRGYWWLARRALR
jgi:N-acetylglucosaminyl-diphospho-decaprenol L-rhamnosyltransferase